MVVGLAVRANSNQFGETLLWMGQLNQLHRGRFEIVWYAGSPLSTLTQALVGELIGQEEQIRDLQIPPSLSQEEMQTLG